MLKFLLTTFYGFEEFYYGELVFEEEDLFVDQVVNGNGSYII